MRKIKTAISATCLLIALFSTFITFAQIGGTNSYSILNLKHNARNAALGMDFLPSFCDDIGVAISNPSGISPLNHGNISLSYTNFFGDINQASIATAYNTKNIGTFALGLQYLNYGNFDMTEENGDVTGRFTAADYVFILSWNKMLDSNIYIGANLKPVFCQYESYSSSAIAIDLGVSYQSDDRTWALSFLARNMGTQITRFALADATLPFELQLTASKKLAHAPFVVYLGLNNLQKWNIREEDPLNPRDEVDLSGNVTKENKFAGFTDNLFRHVQAGVEFVPSQHFYIALGYSWKQNREMNLTDAFSIAGLSYGFGINYRQFRIAYSRCEYHRYGSPNFVSLLIKL
jgi:hypothetical protein